MQRLTLLWNGFLASISSGLATLCHMLGLGTAYNYGPLMKLRFKLRRLTMLWNALLTVTSSGLATLCDKLGLGTADNYGPLAKWCPRRI